MRLPRKTRESGACAGGCLVFFIVFALAVGAILWGAISTYQGAYQMTSNAPRDLGPPPTPVQQNSFLHKLDLMRKGLQEGGPKEYAFSADDLNTWLWANGANAELARHVRFRVEQDWLVAELSVPLSFMRSLPLLPDFSRRFFNGRAAARLAAENGELTVKGFDVEGNGRRLPWLFTGQSYRQAIAGGIKQGIRDRLPAGDEVLNHLENVRMGHDQVRLTLRGAQP